MDTLSQQLHGLKTADAHAITLLEGLFAPVSFKRNWVLSQTTGMGAANLYYITDGLLRGIVPGARVDHCLWMADGGFIVPGNGFLTGARTDEVVEVLADTEGFALNLLRADTLARNHIHLYRMLLEIYEAALLEGRRREVMLRMKTAQERYGFFCRHYPNLQRRATDEQQAQYLHIERKYFYSIKRKV